MFFSSLCFRHLFFIYANARTPENNLHKSKRNFKSRTIAKLMHVVIRENRPLSRLKHHFSPVHHYISSINRQRIKKHIYHPSHYQAILPRASFPRANLYNQKIEASYSIESRLLSRAEVMRGLSFGLFDFSLETHSIWLYQSAAVGAAPHFFRRWRAVGIWKSRGIKGHFFFHRTWDVCGWGGWPL